jgi:hypothetical protein
VITGGIIANGPATGHIAVSGGGTFDVRGDNSQFKQPITIGSAGAVGPTVLIHDGNSLGYGTDFPVVIPVTMFFNSGTVSVANAATSPKITFGPALLDSIGATTAQPAIFTGTTTDLTTDIEFQAAVNLFRPTGTTQNQITVNNRVVFSGGWTASIGTATNLSGVTVAGTGLLTLSTTSGGTLGLDVPLTVNGAAGLVVNIDSAMTSSGANATVTSGTLKLTGASGALNSGASLTVNGASGVFDLNNHAQTVAAVHLLNGTIKSSGATNTLTSTADFDVQAGTADVSAGTGRFRGLDQDRHWHNHACWRRNLFRHDDGQWRHFGFDGYARELAYTEPWRWNFDAQQFGRRQLRKRRNDIEPRPIDRRCIGRGPFYWDRGFGCHHACNWLGFEFEATHRWRLDHHDDSQCQFRRRTADNSRRLCNSRYGKSDDMGGEWHRRIGRGNYRSGEL